MKDAAVRSSFDTNLASEIEEGDGGVRRAQNVAHSGMTLSFLRAREDAGFWNLVLSREMVLAGGGIIISLLLTE